MVEQLFLQRFQVILKVFRTDLVRTTITDGKGRFGEVPVKLRIIGFDVRSKLHDLAHKLLNFFHNAQAFPWYYIQKLCASPNASPHAQVFSKPSLTC
jgi:hypothetical protein